MTTMDNHCGNLGFSIRPILACFGRSVKETYFKIDFQDGSPGGHHGNPVGMN